MSDAMQAAEAAMVKLDAFVAALPEDEQAALAPLLAAGMAKAYEDAQGEVEGFAMNMSFKPEFLNFVSSSKTPAIFSLGGDKFYPPMPLPPM